MDNSIVRFPNQYNTAISVIQELVEEENDITDVIVIYKTKDDQIKTNMFVQNSHIMAMLFGYFNSYINGKLYDEGWSHHND